MGITKIINRCLLLISILCLSFTLRAAQDSSHQISEGNQYIQGQLSLMQDNIRETNLLNVVSYNIDYSNGDTYEITFVLHGDIFSLSFDKQSKATTISGVSATGEDIVIDKKYKKIFADLNHALQLEANEFKKIQTNDNTDAIKYLFKFADFLNSYPIDMPVNLIIKSEVSIIGYTNLCGSVGRDRSAFWTNAGGSVSRTYQVGGHGFCAGRCGPGCILAGDPQYTQDCLNHDACAHREGEQLGVCSDEWISASDDFWLSPDCKS